MSIERIASNDPSETMNEIEAVARCFFEAVEAGDWTNAVSLVSSDVLDAQAEAWRRRRVPGASEPPLDVSSAEVHGDHPITPELYNALLAGPGWWWRAEFPELDSFDDLLAMSAGELAAMSLQRSLSPERIGAEGVSWEVLGAVMDGPDEGYAVYRPGVGPCNGVDGHRVEPVWIARVLRVRRSGGDWKVSEIPPPDWGIMGWRSTP